MIFSDLIKRYLIPILIILLAVLALVVSGCADFGQFPADDSPKEEGQPEVEAPPPTTITTNDRAMLAVYEHLLGQAESYQAKVYLADFYAACDKWSAESELFKDGTSVWYVVVDMTGVWEWQERDYWQQAGWFVFRDGRVIPSNRLKANAVRIEADLQGLSLQPGMTQKGNNGEEEK